jgi:hypothetical protein
MPPVTSGKHENALKT